MAFPSLRFSVSYTTRAPRPGEVDGRDYHFVSEEDFRRRCVQGEFVEWVKNYGHYYGTASADVEGALEAGVDVMLDIELGGKAR